VQVDPIEPKLKLPETKRVKLKWDEPLSNFAFKFRLRHYIKGGGVGWMGTGRALLPVHAIGKAVQVDPMKPMLKAPQFKRLKHSNYGTAFKFCFQIQLAPLHIGVCPDGKGERFLKKLALDTGGSYVRYDDDELLASLAAQVPGGGAGSGLADVARRVIRSRVTQ